MKYSDSLIFSAVMVGGAVLFFLFLYRPAQEEIRFLRNQVRSGQERSLEEKEMTRLLNEKFHAVGLLCREVEQLDGALLDPDDYSTLMGEIRSLCSRLGFRDESVTLKGRIAGRPFDLVVLEVRLLGKFEGVYRFLQGVEDFSTAVRVDHLELHGPPPGVEGITAGITLCAPLSVF